MDNGSEITYKHFFHKLVESIPWPMLIIDTDLRIFHSNTSAQLLFELTNPPTTRQPLSQILNDTAILELIQTVIQTGEASYGEFNHGGNAGIWRVSFTPVEHQDTSSGDQAQQENTKHIYRYFVMVIEDLTELRRLERVRRDFIANISHELRTPLASVRLLAETLEEVVETDPDKAQLFIEKIETEIEYLSELVSELLELSRLEAGRVPMNIEPISASMLVRETMARMLPQAQRHRVMLRTEIVNSQISVAADSRQIARVLVNLVHNAIKFTPSGGTIVIGTHPLPDKFTQAFSVRDTGVGIAPEDLPRIFERFYKVNAARSRAYFAGPGGAGSGLGLAIVRHVIEAHGGHISATSEPGKGSIFTFTLPLILPHQA